MNSPNLFHEPLKLPRPIAAPLITLLAAALILPCSSSLAEKRNIDSPRDTRVKPEKSSSKSDDDSSKKSSSSSSKKSSSSSSGSSNSGSSKKKDSKDSGSSSSKKKSSGKDRERDYDDYYDDYRYYRPYRGYGVNPYYGAAPVYRSYPSCQPRVLSRPPAYDTYYSDGYGSGQSYQEGYYGDRTTYAEPQIYRPSASSSGLRAAQGRLSAMGYYDGYADGIYGPQTRSAIERLQYDHRLPVTGQLDQQTLRILGL